MSGDLFMMRLWEVCRCQKKLDNKSKANSFFDHEYYIVVRYRFSAQPYRRCLLWIQCRMGGVDSDHYWLCRNRNRILWRSYLLYASGIRIVFSDYTRMPSQVCNTKSVLTNQAGHINSFIYGSRSFTYFAALLRRSSSIAA